MVLKYLFLMSAAIAVIWAQNNSPPEPITIPPDIQEKISDKDGEELINQILRQFMKRCEANGGSKAVSIAQNGYNVFSNCLKSLINLSQLTQEIEEAKTNGKVNVVFTKYCKKRAEFEKCFYDMLDVAKPCFSAEENKNIVYVKNVTKEVIKHSCHNKGSRISLFIAESSQYCFIEQTSEIGKCFGTTKDENILTADDITYLMEPISFSITSCGKTLALKRCINNALRNCKETTIANEVESLFEVAGTSTPCHTFMEKSHAPTSIHLTSATILIAVVTSLMLY